MQEITRAYPTELITFNPTVQRIGIQKVYQFDVLLLALPDGRYRGQCWSCFDSGIRRRK